jgi:DNA-binding MurR/RpiR family transcriptional regulator
MPTKFDKDKEKGKGKKEIFARILESYDSHMTAAEQRIADHLLKHPHEGITFSVATLAQGAGTSEATVVRFAKTLGFAGFLDFKQELLRRASRELAGPERYESLSNTVGSNPVSTSKGPHGPTLAQIADSEVANIAETIENLDAESFTQCVALLASAPIVYTVGSGLSSYFARMAAYQFTMIGKRTIALPEGASAYEEQLKLATPKADVLLAFSFPPYSKSVLSLAEFAREQGIPCVCITDRRQSPMARLAQCALFASNDNPLPINSMTASGVLLTAILAGVSSHLSQAMPLSKSLSQSVSNSKTNTPREKPDAT